MKKPIFWKKLVQKLHEKELRTENQDAGISATSEANSVSIHITMPQMMANLILKRN